MFLCKYLYHAVKRGESWHWIKTMITLHLVSPYMSKTVCGRYTNGSRNISIETPILKSTQPYLSNTILILDNCRIAFTRTSFLISNQIPSTATTADCRDRSILNKSQMIRIPFTLKWWLQTLGFCHSNALGNSTTTWTTYTDWLLVSIWNILYLQLHIYICVSKCDVTT